MRTLGGIRTRTVSDLNAVPLPLGHESVDPHIGRPIGDCRRSDRQGVVSGVLASKGKSRRSAGYGFPRSSCQSLAGLVSTAGFEPARSRFSVECSYQLSYVDKAAHLCFMSGNGRPCPEFSSGTIRRTASHGGDSNSRPASYEEAALPTELPRRVEHLLNERTNTGD